MKPPPFGYLRPSSESAVIEALAEHGDEARLLAGGQSLMPMLNFRLARPNVLIDLDRVPGLDATIHSGDAITVGAMTRQARLAAAPWVAERLPLLGEALRHVGHHQIRTRGTIGGSLAHGDPAAELPALCLLLDAELEAHGPRGQRTIPAASFWQAPYTTALEVDELLVSVRLPCRGVEAWSFDELARRAGDFAIAGLAAARVTGELRLVAFGMGWTPIRLRQAESAYAAAPPGESAVAAATAAAWAEVDPVSDVHADAAYRRDAIGTLVSRALRRMAP